MKIVILTLWQIALTLWLMVAFQHIGMLERPAKPELRGGPPIISYPNIYRHNTDWYSKPHPKPTPEGLVI